MPRFGDIARLLRWPNLITAMGDPLVGAVISGETFSTSWLIAGFAALSLYGGGVALNDVCDLEEDRVLHPDRPLPSGRMTRGLAAAVAVGSLFAGIGLAFWARTSAGVMALLMSLTIFSYNTRFKHTPAAPWLMGACRAQSVLLGALAAGETSGISASYRVAVAALTLLAYTAAVAMLARTEDVPHRVDVELRVPLWTTLGAAATIVVLLARTWVGRVVGSALAVQAALTALEPVRRWNLAPPAVRRGLTGRLISGLMAIQGALIAARGGWSAMLGLAWAAMALLHRRLAKQFSAD